MTVLFVCLKVVLLISNNFKTNLTHINNISHKQKNFLYILYDFIIGDTVSVEETFADDPTRFGATETLNLLTFFKELFSERLTLELLILVLEFRRGTGGSRYLVGLSDENSAILFVSPLFKFLALLEQSFKSMRVCFCLMGQRVPD
ncbi:hypothetical protein BpHYR1_020614 [Brachionus plicatilis]|uniref:Uncharacterized protein n=1 Tax=Brachionus plicatilis TaxID=10195 RepID=A0A3M7PRC6_BRAPC|nr:hypothetical protein BpHYR1_020614 [Brachionus plicatilis]